jgi:hypothetical protein
MKNISLERKVEVYEAVLRKLNAYGNLMIDHTKMRELMVALNEYEFSKRDGEKTEEEWEVEVTMAFEKLAKKVGL